MLEISRKQDGQKEEQKERSTCCNKYQYSNVIFTHITILIVCQFSLPWSKEEMTKTKIM
jgi:hypothetical protein